MRLILNKAYEKIENKVQKRNLVEIWLEYEY